jgi:hypothetical protein
MEKESFISSLYEQISPQLNERKLRLLVAALANATGEEGVELLHNITGIARSTIQQGQDELAVQANLRSKDESEPIGLAQRKISSRVRRPGGGRNK